MPTYRHRHVYLSLKQNCVTENTSSIYLESSEALPWRQVRCSGRGAMLKQDINGVEAGRCILNCFRPLAMAVDI